MTNQERAEKILEKGECGELTWDADYREELKNLILSHLDEAVREAVDPWKILCENQLVGLRVAAESERLIDEIEHKLCEQDCECSNRGFASAREQFKRLLYEFLSHNHRAGPPEMRCDFCDLLGRIRAISPTGDTCYTGLIDCKTKGSHHHNENDAPKETL